jgi:aspartate racemase
VEVDEPVVLRTVGILGGMGPLATTAFHRLLVLNTAAATDQEHLHVLVDSDPAIPDRTAFLLGTGPDPRPQIVAAAQRLVAAGAELLVMPCNTANVFVPDIAASVEARFVPWLSTAVEEVLASSDSPVRCGLLATTGTLRAEIYARLLLEAGAEHVEPTADVQDVVMSVIYGEQGVKARGRIGDDSRSALTGAARHLVERGANVLLLGCTELPLAMPADDPEWPVLVVDPALLVARRVIAEAGGQVTALPVAG